MQYTDTPLAAACAGTVQAESIIDLIFLELEERLELSSIAADLFKCLEDLPGVPR